MNPNEVAIRLRELLLRLFKFATEVAREQLLFSLQVFRSGGNYLEMPTLQVTWACSGSFGMSITTGSLE
ncbi:hypothetical protein CWE17_04785 [Synechococcus sp. BS56D]|jgi:hypothetical protein|nr:hypothetical protein Syn8016DRAFT_1786 [Synechococcus sp. WH 8016]TCD59155.1 hypothetical protein CWE17_04785 [Synechococcus sp. BS56D]|tara:strand:- start:367 stop:573 length:207 start_codon:yes stop_codon:yes gene_type:complete